MPPVAQTSAPKVVRAAAELPPLCAGKTVALTATMGALHGGHLSLAEKARTLAEVNIVSVYVNPLQFGEGEDFDSYPRDLATDCEKLRGTADIVFAPDNLYPLPQTVRIALPPLADELCGKSRPGFFQGAATAVCKLFNCVRPQIAMFGLKDFQQTFLMRLMAEQLNFPIKIVAAPTVREDDGLAMSSRNAYLSAAERKQAAVLPQTLRVAADDITRGMPPTEAMKAVEKQLCAAGFELDYAEARDYETLGAPAGRRLILLAAATLGRARLIDNIDCRPPAKEKQ